MKTSYDSKDEARTQCIGCPSLKRYLEKGYQGSRLRCAEKYFPKGSQIVTEGDPILYNPPCRSK